MFTGSTSHVRHTGMGLEDSSFSVSGCYLSYSFDAYKGKHSIHPLLGALPLATISGYGLRDTLRDGPLVNI